MTTRNDWQCTPLALLINFKFPRAWYSRYLRATNQPTNHAHSSFMLHYVLHGSSSGFWFWCLLSWFLCIVCLLWLTCSQSVLAVYHYGIKAAEVISCCATLTWNIRVTFHVPLKLLYSQVKEARRGGLQGHVLNFEWGALPLHLWPVYTLWVKKGLLYFCV